MSDDQLGMIPGKSCAVVRFADAILRSLGGSQITLRLSDPSTGDTASQLGLEAPTAGDMQISPAAIKALDPAPNGSRRIEVLLSATALRTIARNYGVENVVPWLLSMQGVLHDGVIMRIATVTVDKFYGKECLYHLTATE